MNNLDEIPVGDEQLPPPKIKHVTITCRNKEEADRLVACFNACEGIPDPVTENLRDLVLALRDLVRQCNYYSDSDDAELPNTSFACNVLKSLVGQYSPTD